MYIISVIALNGNNRMGRMHGRGHPSNRGMPFNLLLANTVSTAPFIDVRLKGKECHLNFSVRIMMIK